MQQIPRKFLNEDPENIFYRCVEDSSEAIMITDVGGKMVYVNPAWVKIYGFLRNEAIGKTPALLHSGLQAPAFYSEMWSQIRDPNKGFWKGELVNKSKHNELIPVLLTITPFRNPEDPINILGYMGTAVDIREKKILEAEVLRQDRLASVGLIASGLAHEIGTPMGVIRGRAEFLQMQAKDNESLKNGLTTIMSQIDRINKLINSLLRFSRSSNDVQIKSIDLNEVIAEVLSLLTDKLRKENIEIETTIPNPTLVLTDFNRMQQILINLIINSIHAIESRAKNIASGESYQGKISLEITISHDKAILVVIDNGCGIPPENIPKLFQAFFTTKDIGEGTGLGLAIVAKLIHEMGGNIHVESLVNQGTRFYIYLRPGF